ncbi:hypothetical protein [Streptomyces sp. CB02959]|uniref:hypothetical protein n=1 Tax=unclassified Streptomyces TaxID=2593676 RepID=UPI000C270512|nr:hypothetical protein [Streptomyces sp. CB02959]PJN32487.1 hypothetical protein CG747_42525 [Streptomyces sp. CB02959]
MTGFIDGWDRAYPVPVSLPDHRFSEELVNQVAAVLVDHGYPPVSNPFDWGDLDLALAAYLYGIEETE